jgi:putative transcriptional regulator
VNLISTESETPSLRGQLLLATPSLSDGTFDHSVIFIAEHNAKDGAVGAIINHPIGTTVGALVSHLKKSPLANLPVLQGGPVGTEHLSFTVLYTDPENQTRLIPRISAEAAEEMVDKTDHLVQAIVGHSAWTPGQLEDEIERNTWITLQPPHDFLSHPHDLDLWKRLLSGISPYHALLSQAPKNPMLN